MDKEWRRIGADPHMGKAVDDAPGLEYQGARLTACSHQLGLSGPKTAMVMVSGLYLLFFDSPCFSWFVGI